MRVIMFFVFLWLIFQEIAQAASKILKEAVELNKVCSATVMQLVGQVKKFKVSTKAYASSFNHKVTTETWLVLFL